MSSIPYFITLCDLSYIETYEDTHFMRKLNLPAYDFRYRKLGEEH